MSESLSYFLAKFPTEMLSKNVYQADPTNHNDFKYSAAQKIGNKE